MQWARRQHQTRRYRKIFKTTIFAGFISVLLVTIFAAAFGVKKVEAAGATQTATWKSNTVIVQNQLAYSDAGNKQTLNGTQAKVFEAKDKAGCVYQIYFPTNADLTKVKSAKYVDQVYTTQASGGAVPNFGCFGRVEGAVTLTNTQSSAAPSTAVGNYNGSSTPATATTSSSSDAGTIDSCNADGGNLSWVICPFVDMIGVATKGMQNIIDKMMMVDMTNTFDKDHQDTAKAYYAAWNSFRIFGIALIVIAGLVMVISQALGMELFDAYTVKKVLPRLLVAVIGISLSWWLMQFLAGFTNDVGIGIRSVIYSPFKDLIPGSGIQSLGSSLIEALIGGAAILFLGIGGIFSLLLTAGLAALVAFLVLVVRQIVITFLILLAPIAIACYVLPNTEKAYKLWWDSLSKGLMMFPIISAFIATGQMFAVVANSNTNSNFGISNVVAILAYFMPYFALPFTFRLAGGALATLGGLTNDRSRGVFDALKNKRKAIASDRFQRAQNQSLWDNNSRIGRQANKVASWTTDPLSNAALTKVGRSTPGLRKRGARLASVIDSARMEQSGKLFEEANKVFGNNDRAYRAMAGLFDGFSDPGVKAELENNFRDKRTGAWRAPTSLSDFNKLGDILEKSGSETDRTAAHALRAGAGRFATLYQDGEMTKADVRAAGLLGLSAHGFSSGEDIAKTYNAMIDSNDSPTFANTVAQQAQVLVAKSRPDASAGYGITYEQVKDAAGNTKVVAVSGVQQMGNDGTVVEAQYDTEGVLVNDDALGLRGFAAIKAKGPGEWAVAKGGAFKGVKDSGIADHMEFVLRNGDSDAARAAAAEVASLDAADKKALRASAEGRRKLRLSDSAELYTGVRDELLQSASYYSHASADVKDSAAKLLTKVGMGDLVKQYDANRSAGHDPREHEGLDDHGGDTPLPGMGDFGGH